MLILQESICWWHPGFWGDDWCKFPQSPWLTREHWPVPTSVLLPRWSKQAPDRLDQTFLQQAPGSRWTITCRDNEQSCGRCLALPSFCWGVRNQPVFHSCASPVRCWPPVERFYVTCTRLQELKKEDLTWSQGSGGPREHFSMLEIDPILSLALLLPANHTMCSSSAFLSLPGRHKGDGQTSVSQEGFWNCIFHKIIHMPQ